MYIHMLNTKSLEHFYATASIHLITICVCLTALYVGCLIVKDTYEDIKQYKNRNKLH